jgi:hypothetical protein
MSTIPDDVLVPGAGYCPGSDYAKIHIRFDCGTRMCCGVRERRSAGSSLWAASQVSRLIAGNSMLICKNCARAWAKS